jgi:hypothetical protein
LVLSGIRLQQVKDTRYKNLDVAIFSQKKKKRQNDFPLFRLLGLFWQDGRRKSKLNLQDGNAKKEETEHNNQTTTTIKCEKERINRQRG